MNPLSRIAARAVDRAIGLPAGSEPYLVRRDVAIPMPDGVVLLADHYLQLDRVGGGQDPLTARAQDRVVSRRALTAAMDSAGARSFDELFPEMITASTLLRPDARQTARRPSEREVLKAPILSALQQISRETWESAKEWDTWWTKRKSNFRLPE